MEAEKLALERQQVSRFPVEERAISLKRAAISAAGQPLKKKVRPSLPPNPVYKTPNKRTYVPQGQVVRTPGSGPYGQVRPFRNPLHPSEPKPQQAKAQQPKAQPARAHQSNVGQAGQ